MGLEIMYPDVEGDEDIYTVGWANEELTAAITNGILQRSISQVPVVGIKGVGTLQI